MLFGIRGMALVFSGFGLPRNWILLPVPLGAFTASALLFTFAVFGSSPKALRILESSLIGGACVGVPAFLIGFLGPMVFMPEANQGPLFGILVAGPIGFFAGCMVSLLWNWMRSKEIQP